MQIGFIDGPVIGDLLASDTIKGSVGPDSLVGTSGDDVIHGFGGDDTIDGGDGGDLVKGGAGDDLIVDSGATTDVLYGGAGADTVMSGEGTDALYGGGGDDQLLGGADLDELFGGKGDDTLDGGDGSDLAIFDTVRRPMIIDLLDGVASGEGSDTLISIESAEGGLAADLINGTGGDNSLHGGQGSGSDTLLGGAGDDELIGGFGRDSLIGGSGKDILFGSPGGDQFVYLAATDSVPSSADLIRDLEKSDRIDLASVDADSVVDGDQAFHLVVAFSGQAGELTLAYDVERNLTLIQGDVDGDGMADLEIDAQGDVTGFAHVVL